jgi:hypothetical protein
MTTAEILHQDLSDLAMKDGATLTDVLKAQRALAVVPAPEEPTPLPTSVDLDDATIEAMTSLPVQLGLVQIPRKRRSLNESELKDFTRALIQVLLVRSQAKVAEDKIKQIFQTHADSVALVDGLPDETTKRNKDGFFVLPDTSSMAVDGLPKKVVRTVVEPTPVLTEAEIKHLEKIGVLSHAEYLKATKPARVIDEDGVLELIRKRGHDLAVVLAAQAKSEKAPHTQIQVVPNR